MGCVARGPAGAQTARNLRTLPAASASFPSPPPRRTRQENYGCRISGDPLLVTSFWPHVHMSQQPVLVQGCPAHPTLGSGPCGFAVWGCRAGPQAAHRSLLLGTCSPPYPSLGQHSPLCLQLAAPEVGCISQGRKGTKSGKGEGGSRPRTSKKY